MDLDQYGEEVLGIIIAVEILGAIWNSATMASEDSHESQYCTCNQQAARKYLPMSRRHDSCGAKKKGTNSRCSANIWS